MQVHGENIDLVEQDKYLGDAIATTIQSNGSNEINIRKRKGTAIGMKSQIMTILKSVSLGHFYFEIAILLRESLFIGSMMFNSEVWYSLTKAQVKEFEDLDKLLLRGVLGDVPFSVPGEAIFLELGLVPLGILLQARRVIFLHYLVSLNEEDMLSKFFHAQWKYPVRGDWTLTVQQDLKELGLCFDLQQIRGMEKEYFKVLVKKACRKTAFDYLMGNKSGLFSCPATAILSFCLSVTMVCLTGAL